MALNDGNQRNRLPTETVETPSLEVSTTPQCPGAT